MSEKPEQKMLYVDGSKKPFRCSCGCNVFTEYKHLRYKCNGCKEVYSGEKEPE
jgi:hypothetical protein